MQTRTEMKIIQLREAHKKSNEEMEKIFADIRAGRRPAMARVEDAMMLLRHEANALEALYSDDLVRERNETDEKTINPVIEDWMSEVISKNNLDPELLNRPYDTDIHYTIEFRQRVDLIRDAAVEVRVPRALVDAMTQLDLEVADELEEFLTGGWDVGDFRMVTEEEGDETNGIKVS